MLQKIIYTLLVVLFLLLPLINSHLFDLIGIKWGFYVDGNYEFSKVIFFNILSGIIISLFFIKKYFEKHKIIIPKILIYLIGIIIISNLFSSHFFTSLLGNTSKSHSTIMFINIIGLFIVFINTSKLILKKLLITTIISSFIVGIISIKEYYLPTFNYGNLSNRAIGTFGHPNYLALFILILLPFLFKKIENIFQKKYFKTNILYSIIIITLIFVLFLTKSAWGFFIFTIYLFYIFLVGKKIRKTCKNYFFGFFTITIILTILILIILYYPEKLQSFLSRFYIWKTTLNIIFSDIKNVILGGGLGTLDIFFNSSKLKELFIYENIGFTADRPHNLLLNYFYIFGIYGLFFIIYLIYKLIINYRKNPYYDSLVLFIFFTIFNFPSITHYLIIILILSFIYGYKNNQIINKNKILYISIIITILLISIFGIYNSINYYNSEYQKKINGNFLQKKYFIEKIESENHINILFKNSKLGIEKICINLIIYQDSVENNFYCGNMLWNINKNSAIKYYNDGLKVLPDMRNKNSIYYNNYLIKKLFVPERFYAEKFSNLNEILKRVGKK